MLIDTKGAELSILGPFDFQTYKPSIVTVEHNFVDAKRAAIFEVMTRNGYKRHFAALSTFEHWHVYQDIEF
ncbi:FkbM family methyltransferase [Sphingomonas aurantiaca]